MPMDKKEKQRILSRLPGIDALVEELETPAPRAVKVEACRQAVDAARRMVLDGDPGAAARDRVVRDAMMRIGRMESPSLRPVVNATGVIVHTNLGRSLLPEKALAAMTSVARGYSNLEYNLEKGKRGSRYSHVEHILCQLTDAEAALVVNNNAAAVLLCLETLARDMEVIVSRGELVEIGGSFRIPDVMTRSGAILREVGATNRTHIRDYRDAINRNTALLMKVHQSNFAVVGFTSAVSIAELSKLASKHGLHVFEDLGSGTLVDFSRYGLQHEPTVQESLAAGADLVSFSGDKLLGGPQAGIIVGNRDLVDRIKMNPVNRAVRIDKLTLVALEQVLRLYRDPSRVVEEIPTLRMMCAEIRQLKKRAGRLASVLGKCGLHGIEIKTCNTVSKAGGGALPLQELESAAVTINGTGDEFSAAAIEEALRKNEPPVIVRVEHGRLLMDVRTLKDSEFTIIAEALKRAAATEMDNVHKQQ